MITKFEKNKYDFILHLDKTILDKEFIEYVDNTVKEKTKSGEVVLLLMYNNNQDAWLEKEYDGLKESARYVHFHPEQHEELVKEYYLKKIDEFDDKQLRIAKERSCKLDFDFFLCITGNCEKDDRNLQYLSYQIGIFKSFPMVILEYNYFDGKFSCFTFTSPVKRESIKFKPTTEDEMFLKMKYL